MSASVWLSPCVPMVEVDGVGNEDGCSKFRARSLDGLVDGATLRWWAEVGLSEGPADIWSSKYSGLESKKAGKLSRRTKFVSWRSS